MQPILTSGIRAGTPATGCIVRIDRVVLRSNVDVKSALERVRDFRTHSDSVLRNVDQPFGAYGRLRTLSSDATATKLFVYYRPRSRRLASLRVAVVPDDAKGQQRRELERILAAFKPYELVVVELSVDFPRSTR
jgi:hypothetical protein